MKLKYYMRGLGIGIFLTTLILTIGNPKEKLSDEEIKQRASELGMVMDQEEDKLDEVLASISPSTTPTGEPAATLSPSVTPMITPLPSATPELSATPIPTLEPTITPKPTATVAPTATIAPTPTVAPTPTEKPVPSADNENTVGDQSSDNTVTFSVKRGMSSGQVAIVLEEKGLIDNAEDFNKYIVKAGKASIIRVGTYELPKNASYEEIVDKITE